MAFFDPADVQASLAAVQADPASSGVGPTSFAVVSGASWVLADWSSAPGAASGADPASFGPGVGDGWAYDAADFASSEGEPAADLTSEADVTADQA